MRYHPGNPEHRKASIVEFLGLHFLEFGRRRGLDAERIKAEVTILIVVLERPDSKKLNMGGMKKMDSPECFAGRFERFEGSRNLKPRDHRDHQGPELLKRRSLECNVGRGVDSTAKERMETLADEEPQSG